MTDLTKVAPPTTAVGMKQWINSMTDRIADVLPGHIKPETMVRVFGSEMSRTPDLRECTQQSLISALMLCSQLGLEPAGPLGLVYLIPRRNKHNGGRLECNVQIGYKGLINLAQRSGKIARINAQVVYSDEMEKGFFEFSWEPPEIRHAWSPYHGGKDENIVAAYCIVETVDGGKYPTLINRSEIDDRRRRGGDRRFSPWESDFPAMARKSAIRAGLSGGTVPISTELATALQAESTVGADAIARAAALGASSRLAAFGQAAAPELPPVVVEAAELPPVSPASLDAMHPSADTLASSFPTGSTPAPVPAPPAQPAQAAPPAAPAVPPPAPPPFPVTAPEPSLDELQAIWTSRVVGAVNEISGGRSKKTAKSNIDIVSRLMQYQKTYDFGLDDILDVISDLGERWAAMEPDERGVFTVEAVCDPVLFHARLTRVRAGAGSQDPPEPDESSQSEPQGDEGELDGLDAQPGAGSHVMGAPTAPELVRQAVAAMGIEDDELVRTIAAELGMSPDSTRWSEKGAKAIIDRLVQHCADNGPGLDEDGDSVR